jgi:amphiphysin
MQFGFPDPPEELEAVINVWDEEFTPFRKELEGSFKMLSQGKAILQPMRLTDDGKSVTGLGLRGRVPGRRTSSQTGQATLPAPSQHQLRRTPSAQSYDSMGPPVEMSSRPKIGSTKPKIGGALTPSAGYTQPGPSPRMSPSITGNGSTSSGDYFARPRVHSTSSSTSLQSSYSMASSVASKKKPPPPPPKKIGSFHGEFVTAMYDFEPQSEGDLAFREGDRIRVVKKTASSQDWWEGEVNGRKGSFPANYCK